MKTHYAATAIPALLAATVFGVARLGARSAYVVALAALAGARRSSDRSAGVDDSARDAHDAAARRGLALVPAGRARQRDEHARRAPFRPPSDLQLPGAARGEWVAVDERRLTFLDSLRPERARPQLAALQRDPAWKRVFAEDGILVFRRR